MSFVKSTLCKVQTKLPKPRPSKSSKKCWQIIFNIFLTLGPVSINRWAQLLARQMPSLQAPEPPGKCQTFENFHHQDVWTVKYSNLETPHTPKQKKCFPVETHPRRGDPKPPIAVVLIDLFWPNWLRNCPLAQDRRLCKKKLWKYE